MVGTSSSGGATARNSNPNFGQETSNPLTLSDRGLVQRQQEVIQQQDQMLSQIERGVDRLHSQVSPCSDCVKNSILMHFVGNGDWPGDQSAS